MRRADRAGRAHVAWIVPAFPRDDGDPLVPYWGPMAEAVAASVDLDIVTLRFPSAMPSYARGRAVVHPLAQGHVRLRRSPRLWAAALNRLRLLHRRRPLQVIHALHGNEAGFLGSLASRLLGVPLAVHLGGGETVGLADLGYGSQAFAVERWQVGLALRRANRITVGSKAQGQLAARLLPEPASTTGRGKVVLAPVGIRLAPFLARRPVQPALSRPIRLVSVAELNAVKDHATLLRAAKPWLLAWPELRLVLVGGGPGLADLRRLAGRLGIADRLAWHGQIPNPALPVVLDDATVFVHAARHEAQGLALIEAAAAGLPIASTTVGVAAELPPRGLAAAAPGDVAGLSAAIGQALASALAPDAPSRSAALRAAVARFDLPVTAGNWLKLYAAMGAGSGHDVR